MLKLAKLAMFALLASAPSWAQQGTEYSLYFLGGQSNMVGFGHNSELPRSYRDALEGVMIFDGARVFDNDLKGGKGVWSVLQPGHGLGFEADGVKNKLSDRFGPELSFSRTIMQSHPNERIAIIRYARGGSSLFAGGSGYGTWDPEFKGNNQYDNALRAIRLAHAQIDIDGDGKPDRLKPAGILWMQGEADAFHSQASADAYEDNLKQMMDLLRAALRVDDLPVVIGKISGAKSPEGKVEIMDYLETVQQAQQRFVEKDACAAYVTVTEQLEFPEDDPWHYNSDGYIRMGIEFAKAMAELRAGLGDSCEIFP